MAELERLTDAQLRSTMVCYRDLLRSHRQALNRLNVYPVADADTGTNMTLTVESVVAALEEATDMASTCRAISRGALLGGRGISGVILAQLLGAAAIRFAHSDSVDGVVLAQALIEASRAADRAVAQPVEGTILTVARAAARAAATAAESKRLAGVLDAARAAAYDALLRTPELLPALQRAGVVDAGGAGLILLLDALLHVAAGRPLPKPPPGSPSAAPAPRPGESPGVGVPRYEVVLLLDSSEGRIDELRGAWSRIGSSVVVVGGDGTWRCHVHTDDVDGVLEAARAQGRPREVRVTDLVEQVRQQGGSGAVPAGILDSVRTAVVPPPPVPESVGCSAPWAPAGRWPPGRCVPPPVSCWRRSRRHRRARSSSCPTTGGSSRRPSRPPPCPARRYGWYRPARCPRGWWRSSAMTLAPPLRTRRGDGGPGSTGPLGTHHPGDPRRHLGGR
jgi:fatty acid kinase